MLRFDSALPDAPAEENRLHVNRILKSPARPPCSGIYGRAGTIEKAPPTSRTSTFGAFLGGVCLAAVLIAGVAMLLTALVPGVFVAILFLLLGLTPFFLV